MRMRRKPWVRTELAESEFFIDDPTLNIGNWHSKYKRKGPLHLELGCGKGSFIAKLAAKNPNINYLAIDIKSEVLGLAKRNIEKEYLQAKREIDNNFMPAKVISNFKTYHLYTREKAKKQLDLYKQELNNNKKLEIGNNYKNFIKDEKQNIAKLQSSQD